MPRVERELCVARWLAAAGLPAVRACEQIDQPIMVNGHPVSFWRTVTGGEPTPTHADLARLLVMFHSAGNCPCELVTFEPLGAQGTAQADFGAALQYGDDHDVGHPYRAHEQGDRTQTQEQAAEGVFALRPGRPAQRKAGSRRLRWGP